MNIKSIGVIILALVMTGCASGVKRASNAASDIISLSNSNQIGAVSLSLTEQGKQAAAENADFNADELLDHVKKALTAKSILNDASEKPLSNLEVQIKDVSVRSTFSAIMFGFLAGSDSVLGDVVLKDAEGKEITRFEVSASYALGGLAGGQDGARMGWLYEKFAEETVNELSKQ